ncbi:MAG: glycosyl hydrolase, partial [Mucilaginibacter sp.]
MKYKNLFAAATILSGLSNTVSAQNTPMQKNFLTPPDSSKPGLYWYWISGNVSKEGVVKDLESMAKVGIGRAFIGNIGLSDVPEGKVKMFTDDWWGVVKTAIKTGDKVGVDIGMFNSPGWSQSGGPWVKPTEAMRYLASTEITVTGPKKISVKMEEAGKDFQDVAVLAFPAKTISQIAELKPVVTTSLPVNNVANMVDGNIKTDAAFTQEVLNKKELSIDIQAGKALNAQSLLLYITHGSINAKGDLQVEIGGGFKSVKKFAVQRYNAALNVGFIPYGPVVVSFPAVAATKFRLVLSDISGGDIGIAELQLTDQPYLENYIEKQLGKMFQTPLPLWNEYQWKTQDEAKDWAAYTDPAKVLNITSSLSKDGMLNWTPPKGKWTIVRYGMLPTGVTNSPAPPEGTGMEVDKMNKESLVTLYNSYIGEVIKRIPAEDRKAFKYVVADSYETGSQNWTDSLAAKFIDQYGYNPLPYLPVLSGRVVGSADESDRFLWDLRRFVADKVAYEYVGGLRELCHRDGLSLWLENYGHWGFPSEFLKYGGQSDEVGGEFWNEGDLGSIECKAASSSAHIYGKNKVSAESFTAGYFTYGRYPALLKKKGDWSFTEGINNTILHVYITQPYDDKVPGVNAGFSTEFNRNNTWFYQGSAFIDYLRRCNYTLQQGKPVNDVAYFIGEDAPKMTGVRDPELPKGYGYDYINAEVIESRLTVKDGRLVLPDSTSYRILVLPKLQTMRPQLLAKIKELVNAGAVILG